MYITSSATRRWNAQFSTDLAEGLAGSVNLVYRLDAKDIRRPISYPPPQQITGGPDDGAAEDNDAGAVVAATRQN